MCTDHRRSFFWRYQWSVYRPRFPLKRPVAGTIGLIKDGDIIDIDIPNRSIELDVDEQELAQRRDVNTQQGWLPTDRHREVSYALRAYALLATSADKGGCPR